MYVAFRWQDAPLSSLHSPAVAASVYLLVIRLLWNHSTRNRDLLERVAVCHNWILCVLSAVMFLGCVWEVAFRSQVQDGSMMFLFCEPPETKASGKLFFWSYMYYLSKYYELFDTILALWRGSKLPFPVMHILHHFYVLFMAWMWLEYTQSLQFIGLLWNTFVHIFMYYYYAHRAQGKRVSWKRWLTTLQIVQFATSFVFAAYTFYLIFFKSADCAGFWPLCANIAFNIFMFVSFQNVAAKKRKSE